MAKRVMIMIVALMLVLPAVAQQERKFIRGGNELFHKQDFEKAEVEYRKALDKDADSYAAAFNLGDAMYKQKKYDEALQQFTALAQDETDKERLGELYHNIGNTLLSMNKLDESIEAYKQSLRNRPNSQETKYNLEFARKQKQNQDQQNKDQQNKDQQNKDQQNKDQQNKDQQNKDQQNKDQQNKDQQNKDQQNKDQQNKDQQNKDQQNKDQQNKDQQGQQGQQGKISKEDARRLLDALEADEKKTQEKVQKEKIQAMKAKKMKIEKNW